ncbi:MAG: hypothetical protein ACQEV0_09845 [Bacillota bacterium]
MEKNQSVLLEEAFNWKICDYEEYITGYKLYKQLKQKWDASEKQEASEAIQ